MQAEHGIKIDTVNTGSPAELSGLLPEDVLLTVNGMQMRDPIDFMFNSASHDINITFRRGGKTLETRISREGSNELGICFKPFKIATCRNNCIFCFVKQLPRGLRKTLYVKDEDYRMSFLYGNYITLTNLSREDKKRIVDQRLSPLYISVHSTNRSVRSKLLGNTKAPDILKELKFLTENKLRLNVQIVLCPGYNDGRELRQTLSDLYKFYPYILSVAVVPVGLTMHRKQPVQPVLREDAEAALKIIESFQKRLLKKHGNPVIYGADELYLKAGRPFPPLREYGELHQIENGVGMVPLFLNQAKKLKISRPLPPKKRFLTFTGISFYPFLKKLTERLSEKEDFSIEVLPVENNFFGSSVTVAGLLTGRDVIKAVLDHTGPGEIILIPDVVLNGEGRFLDEVTLEDIQEALHIPAKKISSTPEGLVRGIAEAA
ncbi:MAG: DUF512 domain-containing protein [Nitrospirota bacterium]